MYYRDLVTELDKCFPRPYNYFGCMTSLLFPRSSNICWCVYAQNISQHLRFIFVCVCGNIDIYSKFEHFSTTINRNFGIDGITEEKKLIPFYNMPSYICCYVASMPLYTSFRFTWICVLIHHIVHSDHRQQHHTFWGPITQFQSVHLTTSQSWEEEKKKHLANHHMFRRNKLIGSYRSGK